MASKRNVSWAVKHAIHVQIAEAYEHHIHEEARPFDRTELQRYRMWYQMYGMPSVYILDMHVQGIDRAVPVSRAEHGKCGYIPSGPMIIRNVIIN